MTRHEAPGYYCVTRDPDLRPTLDSCTEGRIFVEEGRLICGAGEMGRGYADKLDDYSESTVRRLFGNRFDPQEFDLDRAIGRETTVVVPFSAIDRADLLRWKGSELDGAEHTYAVRVEAPSALDGQLLVQLGRGGRNRGSGRGRHETLALWLDAVAAGGAAPASADEADAAAPTEASETGSASELAEPPEPTAGTDSGGSPDEPRPSTTAASEPTASGERDDVADAAQPADAPSATHAADEAVDVDATGETASADATDEAAPVDAADQTTAADAAAIEDEPASTPDETDRDESEADSSWLSEESDAAALIVKNRSDIRLQPRIRCRRDGEVLFLEEIDLDPEETHRWEELPETGVVHVDVLYSHGSRQAEQLDSDVLASPPVGVDLYASGIELRTE